MLIAGMSAERQHSLDRAAWQANRVQNAKAQAEYKQFWHEVNAAEHHVSNLYAGAMVGSAGAGIGVAALAPAVGVVGSAALGLLPESVAPVVGAGLTALGGGYSAASLYNGVVNRDYGDVLGGLAGVGGLFELGAAKGVASGYQDVPWLGRASAEFVADIDTTIANRKMVQDLGIPGYLSSKQSLHLPPVTDGRSVLTADPSELLTGLQKGDFAILRQPKPGQVVVDFGQPIGDYWSIRQGTPAYVGPTNYGAVAYGKNGAHIYPVNPVQW